MLHPVLIVALALAVVLGGVGPSAAQHDNCVLFSRLDAAGADTAIAAEIAYFASLGHAFEWKLHGHDEPADLGQRLLRHGFTTEPPETIVVRDLTDEPPRPPAALSIVIRRIDDPAGLADLVAVQDTVWNEDHAWYGEALGRELARRSMVLVENDGLLPLDPSTARIAVIGRANL